MVSASLPKTSAWNIIYTEEAHQEKSEHGKHVYLAASPSDPKLKWWQGLVLLMLLPHFKFCRRLFVQFLLTVVYGYCRRVKVQEVEGAIHACTRERAIVPDEIPIEFWNNIGEEGIEWLAELLNVISRWRRCPKLGDRVWWFRCIRTRVTFRIATIIVVSRC